MLQGVAKLEFWEVSEINETEVSQTIQIIDQFAVSQNILNNASESGTEDELDNTSQSDDIESLLSGNSDDSDNNSTTEATENDDENLLANTSSPLLSNLRSEFGGLFYNLEDTMSINSILSNDKVQQLIPNTIKFLWAVKPTENTADPSDQVLELFVIKHLEAEKLH